MLIDLIWWALVLGAAFQAGRAWGVPGAGGTAGSLTIGGWLLSWILPFGLGTVLTGVAAIAIGAKAESQIQKQIGSK
jgi:hypothetical protein